MRKILSMLLATVMLIASFTVFTGCGAKNDGGENKDSTSKWALVTVTDQTGRKVTIESKPEKIVSGYYISTLACITLGLSDSMVGIESKADSRPIYKLAAPELIAIDGCGNKKGLDMEKVTAREPDLVLLAKSQQDSVAALTEMGVPCLVVSPESHEKLVEMIKLIGQATGHAEQAKALTDYYAKALDTINKTAAKAKETPSVLFCGTDNYLTCAPAGMYQATLVTAAGGTNSASGIQGSSYTEISYEQLIAMNPEYIILPSEAAYTVNDVINDSQLKDVAAVKNNKVYAMPSAFDPWDSPVPGGIMGTYWMMNTLHGDLYSMESLKKDATEFYKAFYGFTPDTSAIGQ